MKERGNTLFRFLDRYLGIAIVFFLGIFKRKKRLPSQISRIALLKSAGIGDLVLLSAVIRDLQKAYPDATITLFTGLSNAEIATFVSGIKAKTLPMSKPWKCLKTVREGVFDVWIDCDPWPRMNAILSFFSRSHFTIGFQTEGQHREKVFDCCVQHSRERHEIDNYRQLLKILNVNGAHLPHFSLPIQRSKERKIACHLFSAGSRANLKQWEENKWKELITFFIKQNYEVILTGSSQDHLFLEKLSLPEAKNYAGFLSLRETAELLISCTCVITIDTGIMHLAAALGCSVIALHGPTSPKRWGALGEKVIAITPDFPYHPCIHLGFESICKENRCMRAITVEQVKSAFYQLI